MNPPPGSVRRFTDAASNAGVCARVKPVYTVSTAATRMGMARNRAIVPVLATVRPSRTTKHGDQRKVAAHLMVKSAFRLLSKTDFWLASEGEALPAVVSVLNNGNSAGAGTDHCAIVHRNEVL